MQVCLLQQNKRGVRLIYPILVTRTEDFLIVQAHNVAKQLLSYKFTGSYCCICTASAIVELTLVYTINSNAGVWHFHTIL